MTPVSNGPELPLPDPLAIPSARTRPSGGEEIFVSQLPLIERVIGFVCRNHHLSAADAEEFGAHVKLKLVDHDYAILGKFQGRSSLRTYLTVTIQRLFLDYRNASWGKWRPSAEARRAGSVAVLLERLVTRDNHGADEAFAMLTINYGVQLSREEFERLIERLPVRAPRRFEGDEALMNLPSTVSPEALLRSAERQRTVEGMRSLLSRHIAALPPEDRLILAMRFEDGQSVVHIATTLGLEQKPLYRRVEKLLRDLRLQLEAAGVSAADVAELTGEQADVTAWSPDVVRNAGGGPSKQGGRDEWL